ncbi:hypothetical protein [Halosolutus gelatinilyticus]|uniref:hypothetical protein n=1 Tax=Halosolutus gelatinilyticus TaxID=2931975 RepID=UPI001FF5DB35|nr:hypothetical protein [Halosolutus gelatinilyticus]
MVSSDDRSAITAVVGTGAGIVVASFVAGDGPGFGVWIGIGAVAVLLWALVRVDRPLSTRTAFAAATALTIVLLVAAGWLGG